MEAEASHWIHRLNVQQTEPRQEKASEDTVKAHKEEPLPKASEGRSVHSKLLQTGS